MDNDPRDTRPLTLLPPTEVWDRVDPLAPDLGADPKIAVLGALPYQQLLGPGFERLCYELLVAEGHSPRFFGRSGQRDYGVDIIVESGNARTVYQCKNFAEMPAWTQVRDAILKFETDWLGETGLPSPNGYVYCCPQPLDDNTLGEAWTKFRDEFQTRTSIEVSFWDRHSLDTSLRGKPDVVAGLFSDSYAEHFCNSDEWLDDPWTRVRWGHARHASIQRFLDRHRRGAIHVSAHDEEFFMDSLSTSPVLAIRGMPGAGKTSTGLELACRLATPRRRIYYTTLKDGQDLQRLWQSVRRRHSLPGLFLLDDCHWDLKKTKDFLDRISPELMAPHGNVRLLLVLRDLPGSSSVSLDDTPDWLTRLEQDSQVLDLKTGMERTRAVALHLRHELAGLSEQRLENLHHQSGGDLLLLDEILAGVVSPRDLDDLQSDRQYGSLRTRYFGSHHRLPTVIRMACLAQYDLVPLASFLDGGWQVGEKELVAPLMNELFAPPRYQFLHASLGELVLRALLSLEVEAEHLEERVSQAAAGEIVAYLHHLLSAERGGEGFMVSIEMLMRSRLKLMDRLAGTRIKAEVLADETILSAIESHLDRYSFTFLHVGLAVLSIADHLARERYVELVKQRFRILFQRGLQGSDSIGVDTVATGFLTLSKNASHALEDVQNEHGTEGFLCLIAANGTLFELLKIMEYATMGFREELLQQIDETAVAALVDKTIAAGRSIGTLHLSLRELRDSDECLLGRLEQAIGAKRFLRLIAANGTLFELFRILQYATTGFREELLQQLDETAVAALVDKTIAAGRSIGTLNFTMRELRDSDASLLGRLEQAIGAGRFLVLIAANGTLFELFQLLKYATTGFREELLQQLDETTVAALVDKTIAAGRSIGTLDFTMRELRDSDEDLLGRLEQAIGAGRFLVLIAANGTLFELFKILQYATTGFREELLQQLDETTVAALVDKTIAAGRSIGTLGFTMRELRDSDEGLLGRLEQAIGAGRFLVLIAANGTLFELFQLLKYATTGFREELLQQLDETTAVVLVNKTIAAGRSIEAFHYPLRQFAATPALRERLEDLLGVEGWWRLIIGVGTLNSLSQLTQAMSDAFRARIIAASCRLSVPDWQGILARGLFLNACKFVSTELASYPGASRTAFREALGQGANPLAQKATWFDLNPSRPLTDPDSDEGRILRDALRPRIEAIEPEDLKGLNFREAVNALAFAWGERPDLRPDLASRFWAILPEPQDWPREDGEIGALRLALTINCSELISAPVALRLLETTGAFLEPAVCADIHTLPLFLLVWNLAALRYERGTDSNFDGAIPDRLIETLVDILRERVKPKGQEKELLAQMALAGLVSLLAPRHNKQLRHILKPLSDKCARLQRQALEQTFIPAYFALEGIALIQPGAVFTPIVCMGLVLKSQEYEHIGPAIEHLRQRLQHLGKLGK